jgi:hypothetical protein
MNHGEKLNAQELGGAVVSKMAGVTAEAHASGVYTFECKGPREELRGEYTKLMQAMTAFEQAGNEIEVIRLRALMEPMEEIKWTDTVNNLVTTVGANLALDTILAGSAYTAACFIGLINTNASAAAIGDTMASHAGWLEVGTANAPAYTAPRKTPSWSAAASKSKASSSIGAFAFTSGGTVGGCFLVYGSGAVATIDSTAGVLYSAGAFTGGSKTVATLDSLTVTYTASM